MSYTAKAIANYFLDVAEKAGSPLTPMKLQKLVYYAHGWNLAIADEPLIDEQVEAWTYGPVIPTLYRTFRDFGNQAIQGRATELRLDDPNPDSPFAGTFITPTIYNELPECAKESEPLLRRIWDVYSPFTAIQLSNMTHMPGTPWHAVFTQYGGKIPKGTDIPRDTIRDFFVKQARGG